MRKLLCIFSVLLLLPLAIEAQSMGSTAITQGGHTAVVTAGGSLQVDLYSVTGTEFTGETSGSLPVTIVSGAGSGGTAIADEGTYTLGSTSFTPTGCEYNTGSQTISSGTAAALQCDSSRRQVIVGAGTAGTATGGVFTVQGVTSMTPLLVSPTGTAGSAAPAVMTVQGVASMTPLFMEGHAGGAFDAATGAAPPANAILIGGLGSGATGGFVIALPVSDTVISKNITTGTTTLIITGVSGRQVRIGSYEMYAGAADNVEWIEGTGATCGTGTEQLGSTTGGGTSSGTQLVFSAAGGVVHGSGVGTIMQTATAGDSVCLVTSASANLNINNLMYTIF